MVIGILHTASVSLYSIAFSTLFNFAILLILTFKIYLVILIHSETTLGWIYSLLSTDNELSENVRTFITQTGSFDTF